MFQTDKRSCSFVTLLNIMEHRIILYQFPSCYNHYVPSIFLLMRIRLCGPHTDEEYAYYTAGRTKLYLHRPMTYMAFYISVFAFIPVKTYIL